MTLEVHSDNLNELFHNVSLPYVGVIFFVTAPDYA